MCGCATDGHESEQPFPVVLLSCLPAGLSAPSFLETAHRLRKLDAACLLTLRPPFHTSTLLQARRLQIPGLATC